VKVEMVANSPAGDNSPEGSFECFVLSHSAQLLRAATLILGDAHAAEDLVQEALISVHRHWTRFATMKHPDAYLYRILVNQATSWRRKRSWQEQPMAELPEVLTPDATTDLDFWAALQSLPRRQREAVVLRHYVGLSERQTAEVMRSSLGTVKSQTSKALRALRVYLQTESDDDARG
jgi:RNA polymerase sigma-70 factor (sigma-E family)